MNKIELKYKNWDDVTISVYHKLQEIANDENYEEEVFRTAEYLAVLCEVDSSAIYNLPIDELAKLKNKTTWLGENDFDITYSQKKIKIGNTKYNILQDFNKMTYAQYVDFQTYYKRGGMEEYILTTFLIPEGFNKYNEDYDVDEEAKNIANNLSIRLYNAIVFSFFRNALGLTSNTLYYLQAEMKVKRAQMKMKVKVKNLKRKMKAKMKYIRGLLCSKK